VALAIVLVPQIGDTLDENAARDRREEARNLADQRRRLIEQQRARTGKAGRSSAPAVAAALAHAIEADARRRVESGESQQTTERVECEPLDDVRRGGRRLLSFSCLAVTSDLPATDSSTPGRIGYPYRALADPRDGSFTFCAVAGRAAEGAFIREALVNLPRACG